MDKFTSIVIGYGNMDEIHANLWNKVCYHIMHVKLYIVNDMSWMIGIWVNIQLVIYNNCQECRCIMHKS